MPDLLVRDIPETLVRKLHQRAKANNRSAAEEHRQILRDALSGRATGESWHERADRVAAMTPNVPQTPADVLIREGRDER